MSDISQIIFSPPVAHGSRRVLLHAAGLLTLLLPLAIITTYLIANSAGASKPVMAATLTAGIVTVGCLFILYSLAQRESYPHAKLGLCNTITFVRGAGIAILAGLSLAPVAELGWWLAAFALTILLLDGLDGWAARQARLQSEFGARFDVETDVVFALTLAALAVALEQVGPWFLLLGLLRPFFMAAGHVWPALRAPLPEALWRKQMAGLQMSVQVLLITPLLSPPLATWLAALLLVVMVLSFMIDVRWLARQARRV